MSWVLQTVLEVREAMNFEKKQLVCKQKSLLLDFFSFHFLNCGWILITSHKCNLMYCFWSIIRKSGLTWAGLILILRPCTACAFIHCISWYYLTFFLSDSHTVIFSREVTVVETVCDLNVWDWGKAGQHCSQVRLVVFWQFLPQDLSAFPFFFFSHLDRDSFKSLEEILSWSNTRFGATAFSWVHRKRIGGTRVRGSVGVVTLVAPVKAKHIEL